MNFDEEKELKKMIYKAKKIGGITIPHMKLQIHKNGAKFPISRTYVDDEQLSSDLNYTLIIIPEKTKASGVVLTYFNPIIGPKLFHALPKEVENIFSENEIESLVDSIEPDTYYWSYDGSNYALSYCFNIFSEWSKGTKRLPVIITVILDSRPNVMIEEKIKNYFSMVGKKWSKVDGLYKGFFKDTPKFEDKNAEIDIKKKMVEELFESLEKELINILQNENEEELD